MHQFKRYKTESGIFSVPLRFQMDFSRGYPSSLRVFVFVWSMTCGQYEFPGKTFGTFSNVYHRNSYWPIWISAKTFGTFSNVFHGNLCWPQSPTLCLASIAINTLCVGHMRTVTHPWPQGIRQERSACQTTLLISKII